MTTEQKITQGRFVTYRNTEGTDQAAVVSRVSGDVVDLTVFSPFAGAGTYIARSVSPAPDKAGKEFGDGGAEWPPRDTWRWPERV